MRAHALALLMLAALLAPAASASAPHDAEARPAQDAADALLLLAAGRASPLEALLAQLAHQDGRAEEMLAAAPPLPRAPSLVYRDVQPACDLDGDGAADALVNNLTLGNPPAHRGARSEIEALSGATGARLWKVDNLFYSTMGAPSNLQMGQRGQALPDSAANVLPSLDLDADGTCDVVAYGIDSLPATLSTPVVGDPSISRALFSLRALSGRSGEEIWRVDFEATTTSAGEPFLGAASNVYTQGFPTGVLAFQTEAGPRVLTKTTDLRYHYGDAILPLPVNVPIPGGGQLMQGPPHAEDVRITERIDLRDAATGDVLWTRTLGSQAPDAEVDTRFTNVTWLAGVADVGGDAEPDVLLDELVLTTPRTNEANHPVTGDTLFRYGRGARVTALDGASGATMWSALLLDPLAARPNVETEQNFETLLWTRSSPSPDLDADSVPDIIATYVAQEESAQTTIAGAFRTHVIPLSGATGEALWDVRHQGWGVVRPLDEPTTLLGFGMLDVPAVLAEDQPFPPKAMRLAALDVATGEAVWTYERSFAQNSILSYNLGLAQYRDSLAPFDWNGDGVLDLVTPAQASARSSDMQVLMATSSHSYEVLSGADGSVLHKVVAWGPDGRVVGCDGAERALTVLSGHARRLELARFDVASGERAWRHVLHNDRAPRAATTAIDTVALGAACDHREERTLFAADLQAYSFDRRHEVVAIVGVVDGAGGERWMTPGLQGAPPGDALFLASVDDAPPSTAARIGVAALAAAVGAGLALLVLAVLARAGSRLLAVGLVLLVLAPSAAGLALPVGSAPAAPLAPAVATAPAPATTEAREAPASDALAREMLSSTWSPERHVALVREHVLGSAYSNASLTRFPGNDTISYTIPVGDLDGDGYEEVALDQYCVSGDACSPNAGLINDPMMAVNYQCNYGHDLVVVNGRNGSVLWSQPLAIVGPLTLCGEQFVVGAVDVDGQRAIIVYKYLLSYMWLCCLQGVVDHEIYALSAQTGETLWSWTGRGAFESDILTHMVAKDIVVMPILEVPRAGMDGLLPAGTQSALHLEGVGWTATAGNSFFGVVPFAFDLTGGPITLWDVHEPDEWAARLDLATGAELWRRETFVASGTRNVLPIIQTMRYDDVIFRPETITRDGYWGNGPCCFDTSGDGVPDLVYRVYEWTKTPNAKVAGPRALDVRLVILDGETGETLVDRYVATEVELPLQATPRAGHYDFVTGFGLGMFGYELAYDLVGDADGDGAADLLEHQRFLTATEFHQNISLVSGKSGDVLWSIDTIRDMRPLVLGDADGDGGNDFLLLDWYGHEAGGEKVDDFVTPAAIPLTLHSGRTGERIWRVHTYIAPADVLEIYRAIQRNGIVDVDGDGVGEFFTDDPIYLDDQTVVHRVDIISGRDGSPLRTMSAIGAFAIPSGAGDLDHDGRGEVVLLGGDVSDLWVTVHDGATGEPEWSRRLLALPTSGYARALPFLRVEPLAAPATDVLALTFRLDVVRSYTYLSTCIGCSGEGSIDTGEVTGTLESVLPQTVAVGGADGRVAWSLPALDAQDAAARVLGATPGVIAFDEVAALATPAGIVGAAGREAKPFALPAIAAFVVAFGLVFGAGVAIQRFRSRFEGVPELG